MNNLFFHIILILSIFLTLTNCKNNSREQYNAPKTSQNDLMEANRILVKKDQQTIRGFVTRKGWEMQETNTGLWYEILEQGAGEQIVEGNEIRIKYKVSLLDGTECYNSVRDGEKQFVVGKGDIESGLQQGVLLLKEGAKARFILAPHLAHGLTGDGICIPARAIIIYEVEIIPKKN